MRFSTKLVLVAAPLCAVAAVIGSAILVRDINYDIDDSYAEWGAVEMVIRHMDSHNGDWPRSWEDLRTEIDAGGGRVGGWSFEEYCRRIDIDFTADPATLRRLALSADNPTFNVISATHNTGVHFEDPNGILYRYFRSHAGNQEGNVLESSN